MRLLLLHTVFFFSCQVHKRLHQRAIVVDTHNDVLSSATMRGLNIENDLSGRTHSDINRLRKGGVDVQVFSIFSNEQFGKDTAFKYANIEIDSLYAIVNRNPKKMMMATTPAQIEQALKQNKLACMMGVEGGHMIEDNLLYLDSFYNRGVRYLTLTWNNSTSWATSAMDEASLPPKGRAANTQPSLKQADTNSAVSPKSGAVSASLPPLEGRKLGLTAFGKQVVQRMNQLGMMVDVSHIGEQTFRDVISTTTKPVIASHSAVYALAPVFRNLKDEQLKAIAKNGGVVQLNFFSAFLDSTYFPRVTAFYNLHKKELDSLRALSKPSYEIDNYMQSRYSAALTALRPPLSLLLDHIDYIVRLIGVDHVGLGSDFDGISSTPKELNGVTAMPLITKGLLQRGYSQLNVRKILGENFLRVFAANQSK
jgi:membrane dipeptidase